MRPSLLPSQPQRLGGCNHRLSLLLSQKAIAAQACPSCRVSMGKVLVGAVPSKPTNCFICQARSPPSNLRVLDHKSLVAGAVRDSSEEIDAARSFGRRVELAAENAMQKFLTFLKPRNQNIVWVVFLASELLDICYAHGADTAIDGCATISKDDNTSAIVVVACILEAIALTGAAVGGILARQRKVELERINSQLRQIFARMRRQYQVESYAPTLTYAPAGITRLPELSPPTLDPQREELMVRLKAGKKFLREQNPQKAFEEFEKAVPLAEELKDTVEQKKAMRGLGASCQRQGKFRDAIRHHSMVLSLSNMTNEHTGDTESLGAIADCYTELGDLETAGKYYDIYIDRLDGKYD